MLFGYSLAIDEFVEANQLESADCDSLKICCPSCMEPVLLSGPENHARLVHVQPLLHEPSFGCDDLLADFTPEYRERQNMRARRKRLEVIQRDLFITLLNKDPLAKYEGDVEVVLGKLRTSGAMYWLSRWHSEMSVDISKASEDEIEFRVDGENHLTKFSADLIDVPSSGYTRQVHFEIGYQLMQYLLSSEGIAAYDYDWLFVHSVKLCLPKWASDARLNENEGPEYPRNSDAIERERIAAARIVVKCFCDFLSNDKEAHIKATEILADLEIRPPLAPLPMPLISFIGVELFAAMRNTLFRLPYLSMLSEYDRPCRPACA